MVFESDLGILVILGEPVKIEDLENSDGVYEKEYHDPDFLIMLYGMPDCFKLPIRYPD